MKKLALILIGIILTTIIPVQALDLSDIDTHWAKSNIETLISKGIVNGYPDGTFKPNGTVNADAFIKMVVTALGYKLENGEDYWADTYIKKAIYLGILKLGEIEDYTTPIERKDMSLIISRALNETYPDNLKDYKILITDFYTLDDKYKDAVLKNLCKGIITGYPDGSFGGDKYSTRAEAATIINRLIDEDVRKVPTLPEYITDEDLGIYEEFELVEGFNPPSDFIEPHFRIVHNNDENDAVYFRIEHVNWKDLINNASERYKFKIECLNYPQLNLRQGIRPDSTKGTILDQTFWRDLSWIDATVKDTPKYSWTLTKYYYSTFEYRENGFVIKPNMEIEFKITYMRDDYIQIYKIKTNVREMWKY